MDKSLLIFRGPFIKNRRKSVRIRQEKNIKPRGTFNGIGIKNVWGSSENRGFNMSGPFSQGSGIKGPFSNPGTGPTRNIITGESMIVKRRTAPKRKIPSRSITINYD
jgi:hypothetical protein